MPTATSVPRSRRGPVPEANAYTFHAIDATPVYTPRHRRDVREELSYAQAILLDREARSSTLLADPHHGRIREPLLKVLHLMRAQDFASRGGQEVELLKELDHPNI